jgi:hypothetical protein
MMVLPKPRRFGGFTQGPSCSIQPMLNSSSSIRQSIVTPP